MSPTAERVNPVRIAMWSGPRNISTAMMRSWGQRSDTVVVDEPFYAYYLAATGKNHPGASEIIAKGQTDWREVVTGLIGPVPGDKQVFFQKQMTHHLLPDIDRGWLASVTNCFLIREPAAVITSYIKKNPDPTLEELGFVQQLEIFEWVTSSEPLTAGLRTDGRSCASSVSVVVDARDVLQNPERILTLVCQAIGISFDPAMLSWPPGLRETDGIWADHWYTEVAKSTSFQPYRPAKESVPARLRKIHDRCLECYEQLCQYKLQ